MKTQNNTPAVLTVCDAKGYYKPFRYPFAFDAYKMQRRMDWSIEEVSFAEDIKDWKKLTEGERNLLTQLFRFFTTGDIDVGQAYIDKYMPVFKNEEIRMMLSTFAAVEALHADAYSTLLDSVGMPEVEYQAFRQYSEMAAKHDYVSSFDITDEKSVARALAVFSAFTEGLQLFSTFAILMNFARGDLPSGARMKGMNQIVAWSIKDESLHVDSMSRLFGVYIDERPYLWTDELKEEIYEICRKMVELEDAFIDLAFELGGIEGVTPAEVKQYIRFIANVRLQGIRLEPLYDIRKNPLVWLDYMMNGVEHVNFFENRSVAYARGSLRGAWSDVWAQHLPELPPFSDEAVTNEEESLVAAYLQGEATPVDASRAGGN